MKAQILLSCGQSDAWAERSIAEAVRKRVNERDLGLECRAACELQGLDALRDVVFQRLEEADDFLFVDFKREELIARDGSTSHRGSLVANQELAVAPCLGLADRVLPPREERVEVRGGVLSAVPVNVNRVETFRSHGGEGLPGRICDRLKQQLDLGPEDPQRTNQTRNALRLMTHPDPLVPNAQPFLIRCESLHHRKDALQSVTATLTVLPRDDTGSTPPSSVTTAGRSMAASSSSAGTANGSTTH